MRITPLVNKRHLLAVFIAIWDTKLWLTACRIQAQMQLRTTSNPTKPQIPLIPPTDQQQPINPNRSTLEHIEEQIDQLVQLRIKELITKDQTQQQSGNGQLRTTSGIRSRPQNRPTSRKSSTERRNSRRSNTHSTPPTRKQTSRSRNTRRNRMTSPKRTTSKRVQFIDENRRMMHNKTPRRPIQQLMFINVLWFMETDCDIER